MGKRLHGRRFGMGDGDLDRATAFENLLETPTPLVGAGS
jgi:hypothetical protein